MLGELTHVFGKDVKEVTAGTYTFAIKEHGSGKQNAEVTIVCAADHLNNVVIKDVQVSPAFHVSKDDHKHLLAFVQQIITPELKAMGGNPSEQFEALVPKKDLAGVMSRVVSEVQEAVAGGHFDAHKHHQHHTGAAGSHTGSPILVLAFKSTFRHPKQSAEVLTQWAAASGVQGALVYMNHLPSLYAVAKQGEGAQVAFAEFLHKIRGTGFDVDGQGHSVKHEFDVVFEGMIDEPADASKARAFLTHGAGTFGVFEETKFHDKEALAHAFVAQGIPNGAFPCHKTH
jgi:hypothetical protein